MESKGKGFTLIELMISVAILGILVAIAYPSYARYVQDSWRSSAQLCLLEVAQRMEQRFSTEFTFRLIDLDGNLRDDLLDGGCVLNDGMPARYQINFNPPLVAAGAAGFLVRAVPLGGQAADRCATMTVNEAGVQTAAQPGCW